jgi:hypothetical protein
MDATAKASVTMMCRVEEQKRNMVLVLFDQIRRLYWLNARPGHHPIARPGHHPIDERG